MYGEKRSVTQTIRFYLGNVIELCLCYFGGRKSNPPPKSS